MNYCITCRFYLPDPLRSVKNENGYCRRFPPILVAEDVRSETRFPVVRDNLWCGEWASKFE